MNFASTARTARLIDGEVIPAEPTLLAGGDGAARKSEELKAEAKRRDLWALGHPAEIGGGGLPFMDFVYLNEIIGRSEWGQVSVGTVSMQDSIMLHLYASEGQRERFLKPMARGEKLGAFALSEPDAGSDAASLRTQAVRDGDVWVLNGSKAWVSSGTHAGVILVMARTDTPHDRRVCRRPPRSVLRPGALT